MDFGQNSLLLLYFGQIDDDDDDDDDDDEMVWFCREDVRTANIIAVDMKGVDCLVLEREYVILWLKSIN